MHLGAAGFSGYEARTPMQKNPLFWVASMTNPITAVAAMMLEEQGKLSIDEPASKYLPELANLKMADGSAAPPILMRQILSYMGGLPENKPGEVRDTSRLQDLVSAYVQRPMNFTPGSEWMYSQTGPNTLGRIIEVITGEHYEDYLQKNILDPPGMKDTTFYLTEDQYARLARIYIARKDKTTSVTLLTSTTLGIFEGRDLRDRTRVPLANGGLFPPPMTMPDSCRCS